MMSPGFPRLHAYRRQRTEVPPRMRWWIWRWMSSTNTSAWRPWSPSSNTCRGATSHRNRNRSVAQEEVGKFGRFCCGHTITFEVFINVSIYPSIYVSIQEILIFILLFRCRPQLFMFTAQGNPPSELPPWMKFLHVKLSNPATPLNIRLFVAKLVINTEEVTSYHSVNNRSYVTVKLTVICLDPR